jgi:uncharacterized protein (DUF169 family)
MQMHKTSDDLTCPWCGHEATGATCGDGSDAPPTPGSVTVCIECYGVGEFFTMKDGRLNIKPVNQQDIEPGTRAEIHEITQRLISIKRRN